jgi:hypothetical protein
MGDAGAEEMRVGQYGQEFVWEVFSSLLLF